MTYCSKCRKPTEKSGYCNDCMREYLRLRYTPEQGKKMYERYRDSCLERSKKYRADNYERVLEYQKAYRMQGRDDSLMEKYREKYGKNKKQNINK